MSQNQNQILKSRNRRRRNQVYKTVSRTLQTVIRNHPCDRHVRDEKTLNAKTNTIDQVITSYSEKKNSTSLCHLDPASVYVLPVHDKYLLINDCRELMVLLLFSRVIKGIYTNRFKEKSIICDKRSIRNLMSIYANASGEIDINRLKSIEATMRVFDDLNQAAMKAEAHSINKIKYSIRLDLEKIITLLLQDTNNYLIKSASITEIGNTNDTVNQSLRSLWECFKTNLVQEKPMNCKYSIKIEKTKFMRLTNCDVTKEVGNPATKAKNELSIALCKRFETDLEARKYINKNSIKTDPVKNFKGTENYTIKPTSILQTRHKGSGTTVQSAIYLHKCLRTKGKPKSKETKSKSFLHTILKKLFILLRTSRMSNAKSNKLSCRRNWQIRNVTHGYMLMMLLKKCNIASLTVMNKPYFVIITSETYPITSVTLNFDLETGIATAFNSRVLPKCTFEFTLWKVEHKRILQKNTTFTFCVLKPRKRKTQTNANIECKISASYYECSPTPKIDPSNERDCKNNIENTKLSESKLFYTESREESEILLCKEESKILLNGSVSTLPIDEVFSGKSVLILRKTSGKTSFRRNMPQPSDMQDAVLTMVKAIFLKLFNKCQEIKTFFGLPPLNYDRVINETVFDGLLLNDFVEAVTHYWAEVKLHMYCSIFNYFRSACST